MNKILLLIIVILVAGGFLLFYNNFEQPAPEEGAENNEENIFLTIDGGEKAPQSAIIDFKEGMTAFGVLEDKARELGLTLKTSSFDIGIMVEAIGDKVNGQDGKYWLYYINGEMPMVAADKREIKAGDRVEFKFEKSPF